MSAALAHPEPEDNPPPAPAASSDWEHYASYVPQFTGHRPPLEREVITRHARRHKRFHVSALFCAGTLLTCELIALVWLYALDLKTIRYSNQLDRDIKDTSLRIALTQDKLAGHNASPRLNAWASELGFQKAAPHDMDDVTSDAPMPAPTPRAVSR